MQRPGAEGSAGARTPASGFAQSFDTVCLWVLTASAKAGRAATVIPWEAGAQRGNTGISRIAVSGVAGIRTHSLWPLCLHLPAQQLSGNLGAHILLITHLSPGFWSASNVIPEVQFEDCLGSHCEVAATEEGLAAHTGPQTCLQPPG